MMTRRKNSSRQSTKALTIIEVVAGLALLASIMASLLLAKMHWQRRLVDSRQRLAAVAAADGLLSTWWQNPRGFPVGDWGTVPAHPELRWQTYLVNNPDVARLGARAIRLEILPTGTGNASPLSSVELVLPNPDDFHD